MNTPAMDMNRRGLKEWMLASGASIMAHVMVVAGFVAVSMWAGGGETGGGAGGPGTGIVDIDLTALFPAGGKKVDCAGEVSNSVAEQENGKKQEFENESDVEKNLNQDKAEHVSMNVKAESVCLSEKRPEKTVKTAKKKMQGNENEGADDVKSTSVESDGDDQIGEASNETGEGPGAGGEGTMGEKAGEKGGDGFFLSLDQYRELIKRMIRPNWASARNGEPYGNGRAETRVAFEVMPDGDIRCVRLERVSGSSIMDDAAMAAVKRTGTVRPHPQGINRPYIEMVVVFTPKDLR